MNLRELADQHHLDLDLLQEVVVEDLGIKLPKGLDTVLKEEQVTKILACDGLETRDGKAFKPIVAKEFEEKHKRSVAAKKAAATRKQKEEDQKREALQAEETRIVAERKKHAEELERRRIEEEARLAAEADAAKKREAEMAQARGAELDRLQAEEELLRREEERKRIASELSAMRQAQSQARAEAQGARAEAAGKAPAQPVDRISVDVPAEPSPAAPSEAPLAPKESKEPARNPGVLTLVETVSSAPVKPAAPAAAKPAAPEAAVPATVAKATAGLGSKLANLAKQTHEKADHSIKAAPVVPGSTPQAELTLEDRRKLIQANIARNLDMAKRVAQAKAQSKKPGFRTIDRTKSGGTGGGPARPGGPGRGPARPGGPGRPAPGRGRGRAGDAKDAKDGEDEGNLRTRRYRSTLDEDISGVTEFEIVVPTTVREFSEASGVKSNVIIAKLFMAGVMANINSVLDKDSVELLAAEFKKTVIIKTEKTVEEVVEELSAVDDKPEDLAPRPPVVTVMGHVDHGKTSLLDAIKATNVADGEAGGITQHIGAYTVTTKSGMDVTFIDTPGHEAFTEMRARGSKITDVALIVVAGDDGVMPQTLEAVNHAKAAGVSIVVAINKCDKPEATPKMQEKILQQLASAGVQAEEWGGEVAVLRVSAKSGEGIDGLLERLALETEVLELNSNHTAKAQGTVIEARRDDDRGIMVTLLVRRGTLFVGDIVLAGTGYGRVRSLTNWKSERVDLAGPSHAVEITGLDEVPRAGDKFQVMDDMSQAADAADQRRIAKREKELQARAKTTTAASLFSDIAASKKKEVRLVVKTDTAGSLEVINKASIDLTSDEVRISVIHSGVGGITASDVTLAEASKAFVIGFHVIADAKARATAEDLGIDIRTYTIIYQLLDDLRNAQTGLLEPEYRDVIIGHADVRQTFAISKVGVVAGLFITDGLARRDAHMRITRDQKILHTGKVGSLRRFKEDVKEVKKDFECGLTVENFQDIQVGDIFEFYTKERVIRKA